MADDGRKDTRQPDIFAVRIGRRSYSFSGIGKGIVALVATGVACGAVFGTMLHILGWDFVSVRGSQLAEVQHEISTLHRNDSTQVRNQDSMLTVLRRISTDQERTARYLCFFMRRYEPSALEPNDPCQPIATVPKR